MGLFDKPEVTVLKESSDAKVYLEKLNAFQKEIVQGSDLANIIDKEIAITKAGITGEEAIMFELKNSGMDLVVLHDIYIETSDGRGAQIDFLVITPYVNVLIECKNLFGNIEINSKGDFIRSFSYRGKWIKEGIYSPITQNERHLTVFRDCRGETKGKIIRYAMMKSFDQYNKSLVVLANSKTLINDRFAPKEIKQTVIRGDQLIATLKSFWSDLKRNKKEMISFGEKCLSMNREDRKDYIMKYQELADQIGKRGTLEPAPESTESKTRNSECTVETSGDVLQEAEDVRDIRSDTVLPAEKLICPWCGKELVLRTAKKGMNAGKQFYGCSGFPKCRYVKNIKG